MMLGASRGRSQAASRGLRRAAALVPQRRCPSRQEKFHAFLNQHNMSRRGFCLCCMGATTLAATGGWLTPTQAFAKEESGTVRPNAFGTHKSYVN
jgi:hypothetical protein